MPPSSAPSSCRRPEASAGSSALRLRREAARLEARGDQLRIAGVVLLAAQHLLALGHVARSSRGVPCSRHAIPGGVRSNHGCARSSWPARRNSVASSPNRPTKCMPTGSPPAVQWSGTDIAGCPVTLKTGGVGHELEGLVGERLDDAERLHQPAGVETTHDLHLAPLRDRRLERARGHGGPGERRRQQDVVRFAEPGDVLGRPPAGSSAPRRTGRR